MLVKIYTENPSEKEIDRVVNLLERDGVVIYPTDSVYAFGCSLHSPKAIERLRRMRGKDAEAFSVVFGDIAQVAEYCRVDNPDQGEGSHDVFRRVRFARADCRLLPGG